MEPRPLTMQNTGMAWRRHSVAISPVQVSSPVLPNIATEQCAGTDRDGLGFATHGDMVNLVVFGNAANEGVDPIVRQTGSQPHAGFDKLGVNFIVDVHTGCFF